MWTHCSTRLYKKKKIFETKAENMTHAVPFAEYTEAYPVRKTIKISAIEHEM